MVKNRVVQGDELPTKIEELANNICLKINEIELMEEVLKNAKNSKDEWLKELAEVLDISGFKVGSSVVLKNGRKMKLKDFFSASIPSKTTIDGCRDSEKQAELIWRKDQAMKWLDDNGAGDVIKNQIIAVLPRGSNELAVKISEYLSEISVSHIKEESVNHMTLVATLKNDFISKNKPVPKEIFGVIEGVVVEIK